MKKILLLITVIFLNGCAQSTSFMGPTYTMVKTGSVMQTSSSIATSYGLKQTLGKSPFEYITSLTNENNKINECRTFHSASLNEIFFETLDEIDCLRDPFSIIK